MSLPDISENMLESARHRFTGRKNITYIVSDYSPEIPPGPYDMVCSAFSIHHLTLRDKRSLFRKVFSALKPGGLLVNADQADSDSPYFRKRYLEYWNEFLNNGPMNILSKRRFSSVVIPLTGTRNYQFNSTGCRTAVFLMLMWFTGIGYSRSLWHEKDKRIHLPKCVDGSYLSKKKRGNNMF
jgi:ubiquinone/menaquinone biosynthesis C-methylase UbiE